MCHVGGNCLFLFSYWICLYFVDLFVIWFQSCIQCRSELLRGEWDMLAILLKNWQKFDLGFIKQKQKTCKPHLIVTFAVHSYLACSIQMIGILAGSWWSQINANAAYNLNLLLMDIQSVYLYTDWISIYSRALWRASVILKQRNGISHRLTCVEVLVCVQQSSSVGGHVWPGRWWCDGWCE